MHRLRSRGTRPLRPAVVGVLAAALCVGCSGGGGSSTTASPAAQKVAVTVRNFRIDAPATIAAGTVTFELTGMGPTMHEFNVARTDLAGDQLPKADDGTVDDTSPHDGFTHLAEREGIDIGNHKTLTVALTPGRYVFYCNMYGHYRNGMWAAVTVS